MAETVSGISIVRDVKNEGKDELAKPVQTSDGSKVPDYVEEIRQMDLANDRIFRFMLISNLTGIRLALEEANDLMKQAPVQRVMQVQMSAQDQLKMQEQMVALLGGKPNGRSR